MRRFRLAPFALILATAALTCAAGLMLFSAFMLYDDEGYVLFSLKNFAEHGHLYREVYSQYGPLPYAFWWLLHGLGVPFSHHAGRVLTLGIWATAAAGGGALVWRLTRDFAAALATLTATFCYLWVMMSEPSHPGGLIVGLITLLAWAGSLWLEKDRTAAWAALTGAGVSGLLLTKINVGGFAALSFVAFFLLHQRNDRRRQIAPWLVAGAAALLPWGLMRALLDASWVQTYALVFTLGALPTIGAATLGTGARFGGRELRNALAGGALMAVSVLGLVLIRGTYPAELLDGMLLGPLRHPVNFSLRFVWPASIRVGAGLSLVVFIVARIVHPRAPERVAVVIAVIRLGTAVALALTLLRFPAVSPDNLVLAWSVPLLWPLLWPLPGEAPARIRTRTWLGLLFLGQWLHAYPVPGSQIAWGTFLALPLTALGAWEAANWLAPRLGEVRRAAGWTIRLGMVAGAAVLGLRFAHIGQRYRESRPLGLPGAEMVRLPDGTTAMYRLLALNATAHTDVLFSFPGMFSFNLWTDEPGPTLANATHWFSLLNPTQQQAIIDSLAAHPRAGVIVQTEHLDFLRERGLTPHGPLVETINRDYETAFTVDGFDFRVRKGRRIAAFQTAQLLSRAEGGAASNDALLQLTLLLPAASEVASVEIAVADSRDRPVRVLTQANARIEITPINSSGGSISVPVPTPFPFKLNGPALVNLYFDGTGVSFSLVRTLIVLRDASGRELALVRLRP